MDNLQSLLIKFKNKFKDTECELNHFTLKLFNECNINFSFDSNNQNFHIIYNNNKNNKSMIIRLFHKTKIENINNSTLKSYLDIQSLISIEFINGDKNFIKKRKYHKYLIDPENISLHNNFNFNFWFDRLQNINNKLYIYNNKIKFIENKIHNKKLKEYKKTTDMLFQYITDDMAETSYKELSEKESFKLTTLDYKTHSKTAIFKIYNIKRINENTFEYKDNDYGFKKVIGYNQLKNLIKKQFYFKSKIVSDFHSFYISNPSISYDGKKYILKIEEAISKFKPYLNAENF